MKFLDLLLMSVNNLRRRKLRTGLTVLGVVIGTASIVVMVSLGIGLNKTLIEQIAGSDDLTLVSIYNYRWGASDSSDQNYITDSVIKQFERLPHVTMVSPLLNVSAMARQGAYEGYLNIYGVTREYLEKIPLGEGGLPTAGSREVEFVVGNTVIENFYNRKTNEYYWETGVLPDVDFMNLPLFVIFDMDSYYQALYGNDGTPMPKKYMINTAAMTEGAIDDWSRHSYRTYVEIESLKSLLKQIFKKRPIPGQPTTSKGKAYPEFIYDEVMVYVDDMNNVTEVQEAIRAMGYEANSNMEYLESMQTQSQMVQAVLGGIGAVSLFVAAIGIANTMMMSIYERTKEIGIIKVLGCGMGNIQTMFLMEAGFIGFIGGVMGLILSFGISFLLNRFLAVVYFGYDGGTLSSIPPWLALLSLGFAVIVGMVAGFFPARRAMKLSPLAAIKTE